MSTIRRPSDTFEASLFRAHIVNAVEHWTQAHYRASVGHELHEDGTWTLYVSERRNTPVSDSAIAGVLPTNWPDSVDGRIWIADEYGRPVVAWSLENGMTGEGNAPIAPFGIDAYLADETMA